MELKSARHR